MTYPGPATNSLEVRQLADLSTELPARRHIASTHTNIKLPFRQQNKHKPILRKSQPLFQPKNIRDIADPIVILILSFSDFIDNRIKSLLIERNRVLFGADVFLFLTVTPLRIGHIRIPQIAEITQQQHSNERQNPSTFPHKKTGNLNRQLLYFYSIFFEIYVHALIF